MPNPFPTHIDGGDMKARRVLTVLVLTAGAAAVAAPASATTQVDVILCDSLATSVAPGGCVVNFSTIPLTTDGLSGAPITWGVLCSSPVPIPTVTTHCVIFEVDEPS